MSDLAHVRKVGAPLDEGETWLLVCYINGCRVTTQGGWPGMASHLRALHYPSLSWPRLLESARKASPPRGKTTSGIQPLPPSP